MSDISLRIGGAHEGDRLVKWRKSFSTSGQHLAAIVENSDDAILTKDLNGIITSWNRGAESIYGYTADEIIGLPVTVLIPSDHPDEEPEILRRIRNGERIEHYETVRQRKDGTRIYVSLSVSPIRDGKGRIIGASKIARDITERQLAQERQRLLLAEMQHRIKNVFALASSLIGLCAARSESAAELAELARQRLGALAEAHALTVPDLAGEGIVQHQATLHSLIKTLVAPAIGAESDQLRLSGEDLDLSANALTSLALVLNELVANAVKYGAFTDSDGIVTVHSSREGGRVQVIWKEHMDRPVTAPTRSGFGTRLSELTAERQLGGSIKRHWEPDGLHVAMEFDAERIAI